MSAVLCSLTLQTSWDFQHRLWRTSHGIAGDDFDVDGPFRVLQLPEVNGVPARPALLGLYGVHHNALQTLPLHLDVKACDLSVGRHRVLTKKSKRNNYHLESTPKCTTNLD